MSKVVEVDPFRCRLWDMHVRLEDYITEDSCRNEIDSFAGHGQLAPVLGRRVPEKNGYDIELIYGARRLFAARHTGRPLAVELRDISDREALVAMEVENSHRKDVSPYERGIAYARWLRSGHFQSQDEMARTLGVSAAQLCRLLKLARLPSIIVEAFGSGLVIAESWGSDLADAIEDPEVRRRAIRVAREITASSPRLCAKDVFRRLMAARTSGRKPAASSRDIVVRGADGAPLFRIKWQRKTVALIVPIELITSTSLGKLRTAVSDVLQDRASSSAEHAQYAAPEYSTLDAGAHGGADTHRARWRLSDMEVS